MTTKLTLLLLAAAININSLVNSSNAFNVNESIINYKCLSNAVDNSVVDCTDLDENVRIKNEKDKFFIQCYKPEMFNMFNYTIFPKVDLYEVHTVYFVNCIAEQNINFGSVLAHFGINNTKLFWVQNMNGSLQPLLFSNGFERLENLTVIYSLITKLDENDFQGLKEIRQLILFGNKISDIPRNIFANLTNLQILDLSENKIESLNERLFSHQKKLGYLSLNDNEILDLPQNIFANLTNVEYLLLSKNKMKFLEKGLFTYQKKLRELSFDDNEISDLPSNIFANLTNLENLLLSKNKMKFLEKGLFTYQKKLRELSFDDNEISDLPSNIFANLTNLENLLLSKNKMKFLEKGLFTYQKKLRELSFDDNEISDLPSNIFANLTNLENLLLSKNKIQFLKDGLFTHQKKLMRLDLSENKISYLPRNIFVNLTNLEYLYLSENKLNYLQKGLFTHQKQLRVLALHFNEISDLSENIFANLTNLEDLALAINKIKFLTEELFTHQKKLKLLRLDNNEISYLPGNIFANLTSLKEVKISQDYEDFPVEVRLKVNRIESFTKDLTNPPYNYYITSMFLHRLKIANGFALPSNFELLTIKECEFELTFGKNVSNNAPLSPSGKRINVLPADIFANQNKLKYLSVEMNELTEMNDGLFNGLNKLERLHLSYNNLTSISRLIFRELHNLNIILLDHNHIKTIHSDAFANTAKLSKIDLSYNQLQYFDSRKSPFMYLEKLSTLNLSNNYLTALPSGWKDIKTLHLLDLGFNNISSYKYGDVHNSKNKIYYKAYHQLSVDKLIDMKYEEDKYVSIFLNNITLKCDCSMLRFLFERKEGVINGFVNHLSEICEEKRYRCNETIASYSYDCPITEYVECKCTPNFENHVEMRCKRPEAWNSPMNFLPIDPNRSLELYINNNIFTELPNLQNNERVIIIQASYNSISDIKLENIPPNLRFLDVSYNKIKAISTDVIDALHNNKKFEAFLIENNKWQCDCSTNSEKFIEFFTEIISMTDFQETKARLPSDVVIELSSEALKDYCAMETQNNILYILALLSAIIGIPGIFIVILLYKYKKALKIWLYAHNICLCCIGEDEFDKDKKFDAFISYSYHDEDLAVSILNELETGNPKYNICIHERDFVPGRLIQLSIVESMDNSCRTIIVLSKHFLRSVWGLREFRRAYESGLAERRMRLIIVINGDIGDTDQLEPTIKCYLKTHTYIKWGDPWFWRKMRYALPHRNRNDDGGNTATNNIEMRQMS